MNTFRYTDQPELYLQDDVTNFFMCFETGIEMMIRDTSETEIDGMTGNTKINCTQSCDTVDQNHSTLRIGGETVRERGPEKTTGGTGLGEERGKPDAPLSLCDSEIAARHNTHYVLLRSGLPPPKRQRVEERGTTAADLAIDAIYREREAFRIRATVTKGFEKNPSVICAALEQVSKCYEAGSLESNSDQAVTAIISAAHALIDQYTASTLTTVVMSIATLDPKYHSRSLLDELGTASEKKLKHLTPQELVNLAWGFSRLGYHAESLFNQIGAEAGTERMVREMAPGDMSNLVWAFANIGIGAPPRLVATIGKRTQETAKVNIVK